MLSESQIKATIVQRIMTAYDICNSRSLDRITAQLEALVYVLGDGEVPPASDDATVYLKLAGIPFTEDGEQFEIDRDWLVEHGFQFDEDGNEFHPTLGINW